MTRTIEVLSLDECRALLATHGVGRVAVVVGGYPEVFPVNYVVSDDRVLFRTDPGVKLAHARFGRVCFQVDHLDFDEQTGWSVLIKGVVHKLRARDPDDDGLRRAAEQIQPWAAGDKAHVLVITPVSVTGRRILP